MTVTINSARLSADLATLANFSSAGPDAPLNAVTRIVFSDADLRARAWLKHQATDAGFVMREDAVGNTFIRWHGTQPDLPAIANGSHIDAIPNSGRYDGTVGVLGGLEAMRALKESGLIPRRSIELLLLTSEEPTRFGIGCLGSRILSGALPAERADALHDSAGHTLAEVRHAAGFSGPLTSLPHGHYHAWLELHIEQGPLLERANLPIGIVSSIAAPAGYRFTINGFGGHAGALLMPNRRDALCAAAELILAIERHTLAANAAGSNDAVATVGTCDVFPNSVNSVPSRVTLQLDIRDIDPTRRESIMQAVRADITAIATRRRLTIDEAFVNADDPAPCAPHLVDLLASLCAEHHLPFQTMVSRAYHDSTFLARIAPIAMIFIPCLAGVSHKPDEYAAPEDIARGTTLLAAALARLAE